MRLSKWMLGAVALGMLPTATVPAQQAARSGLRQPATHQQTAYAYDRYYADEEPADEAYNGGGSGACNACGSGCCDSCDNCCSSGCCGGCCDPCSSPLGDPWKLVGGPLAQCWGLDIGGWLLQSFTWNPDNPADNFNGPVTMLDRANEWQGNMMYVYAGRATDTGGSGIDIGGRVDAIYGTDYRFVTATGLEDKWNSDSAFYGLALPQFYLEGAINDLTIKAGHFYAPCGYYVYSTPLNFFNTLPYTFQYGEPFTHTGIHGVWKVSDNLSIGQSVIRGWDNFDNFNPNLGWMSTLALGEIFTEGDWFNGMWMWSNEPSQGGAFTSRYLQTLVYSFPLTENLTYVGQTDFGQQDAALANGKQAHWYGLNQYLLYTWNTCWAWGMGFEIFRDEDGFRVGQLLPSVASPNARGVAYNVPTGFAGNFYQITVGPQWRPGANPNIMIRPNLRWDWYEGNANPGGQLPFDDGTDSNQMIWGTDLIMTF